MGIAAHISQYRLRAAKGRFGVDHPFGLSQRCEMGCEGIRIYQPCQIANEDQLACFVQSGQTFKEQPPGQPRQNLHGQEEAGAASDPLAIICNPATRNDDMHMGMARHRRSPGMQHAGHAHPRAHALGIGSNGGHRFSRRLEQQPVDRLLVPIGDLRDLGWQGEDDVEILDRQQILGARGHPVARPVPDIWDNAGSCRNYRRCAHGRIWCSSPHARRAPQSGKLLSLTSP